MLNLKEKIRLTGELKLDVYEDNVFSYSIVDSNMIVNTGLEYFIDKIIDTHAYTISEIAIGSDSTANSVDYTYATMEAASSLTNVPVDTLTNDVSNAWLVVDFTVDTATFNNKYIREFGMLYYNSVGGVYELIARKVLGSPIAKTSSISVNGTWTIRFTDN